MPLTPQDRQEIVLLMAEAISELVLPQFDELRQDFQAFRQEFGDFRQEVNDRFDDHGRQLVNIERKVDGVIVRRLPGRCGAFPCHLLTSVLWIFVPKAPRNPALQSRKRPRTQAGPYH